VIDELNLLSQRVVKAMEEATTNIVEATPIETSTSSQNGLNE
jgi:hypothetical protein